MVGANSLFIMLLFSWTLSIVWNMPNTHILEANLTPIFRFHTVPHTSLLTNFWNYASRIMSLDVSGHILTNMLRPCLVTVKSWTYPIVRNSTTLCLKVVSCLIRH